MLVVKRFHYRGKNTLAASRVFDKVITKIGLPLNFERLEFNFGREVTHIEDENVELGIPLEDDRKLLSTMITFELFRPFVRRMVGNQPRIVEDVIAARHMIRNGYADDLSYSFYVFVCRHKVRNLNDYLRLNLPWIIFYGIDNSYSELFREIVGNRKDKKYEAEAAEIFSALKKDLWNEENVEYAGKLVGVMDAGD